MMIKVRNVCSINYSVKASLTPKNMPLTFSLIVPSSCHRNRMKIYPFFHNIGVLYFVPHYIKDIQLTRTQAMMRKETTRVAWSAFSTYTLIWVLRTPTPPPSECPRKPKFREALFLMVVGVFSVLFELKKG